MLLFLVDQIIKREKADLANKNHIGSPMSGVVVELKAKVDEKLDKGDPILVLSAMKMESILSAPFKLKVVQLCVKVDDNVSSGDLCALVELL